MPDLQFVYDSEEELEKVKNHCLPIQYRKFLAAQKLTASLAAIMLPQRPVDNPSLPNVFNVEVSASAKRKR